MHHLNLYIMQLYVRMMGKYDYKSLLDNFNDIVNI